MCLTKEMCFTDRNSDKRQQVDNAWRPELEICSYFVVPITLAMVFSTSKSW